MKITLATGQQLDTFTREFSRHDPYLHGAEIAFDAWSDFMHGHSMDVRSEIPGYHLTNVAPAARLEMVRGFDENLNNNDLIEASRNGWRR